MNETIDAKGSCLCGAVTMTTKSMNPSVGACHCNMCRKWSGGPLLGTECGADVDIEGEENITRFSSSEWAERAFCSQCGTHLFYYYKPMNSYFVPAGLFEQQEKFTLDRQIFIDEKPDYFSFSNKTKDMTGEEVFAQFSGD